MDRIAQIELNNVASVYSGQVGKCCCGCSGKHTYAKQHQAWASKHRGYEVTDDEVNDRVVKLMVGKMEKAGAKKDSGLGQDLWTAYIGNRVYVAYMKGVGK